MVPSSLGCALPAAVTVPVAVTGGQADAHAPEQADMFLPSLTHRYTAWPVDVVRNAPPEPAWVVITVPVAAALAELPAAAAAELAGAAAELAGAEDDELAALPHAATISAEATGMPSLTGMGIRVSSEWIIFIVSFRAARSGPAGCGVAALSNWWTT